MNVEEKIQSTTIDDYCINPKLRKAIGIFLLIYVSILVFSFFVHISEPFIRVVGFMAIISVVPELSLKAKIWVRKE